MPFRFALVRLLAAFLLAVVALQAVPLRAVGVERSHGSAFDISTIEVSVAPYTRKSTAAEIRPIEPPPPLPVAIRDRRAFAPIDPIREFHPRPPATGPPLRAELASLVLAPRAPPIA